MGIEIVKQLADPVTEDHALYRFFAGDGDLLYIGISLHPFQRMGQHRHEKSWWGEVATVTIERHPDRRAVLDAERAAIKTERPRYNVVHASPRRGKPRARCHFTYWEPAVDGLLRLADVFPREAMHTLITCGHCGRSTSPSDFYEMPLGEIQCCAKCPECSASVMRVIEPTVDRLVIYGRRGD